MAGSSDEVLRYARQLVTLGTPDEILAAACKELRRSTGAARVVAGCCPPHQSWTQSIHTMNDETGVHPASPVARSALFALHRRLSQHAAPVLLQRSEETAAMFDGLACRDELVAVPIVHRTGRVWGALVVLEGIEPDLLEVMRALAELTTVALENAQRLAFARRDQDRLLLIAEATSDALYDWSFDTRDFWWGGGIGKLLGPGTESVETNARWKLDRIHPDDRETVRTSLHEARFGNSASWTCEYRFSRADGSYVDVEDRGYFLRETGGRAYRMIGSMRDISTMRSLLAREQLARREAERANRAKDEFLAMLGHELRNPLAPIITGLQLIRLRGTSEMSKELNVIERQAQHLIQLVDDLLDISRIAHAKIELKKERLEIASVVAAAIETASPLIESRLHTLEVNVEPRGLPVTADRARLAQAIANLLTNAAKYTEPGGRITIAAKAHEDHIELSIRDTGIGIAPEMLPNVFNMFVQESQALDRAQGGLGLGLTIVRSLVELHGGYVEARSEGQGRGSQFTLRLPIAEPEIERTPRTTRPSLERVTGRRILVVDDNADAADLLSILLERMGNTTVVAHDASEALALIEQFAPDVAVLDIGLPVMDGYELAKRLREHPVSRHTRLIALSGYGQASDKERSQLAGFDAHLVKPIAVQALREVIDKLDN